MRWAIQRKPAWASFNPSTGELSGKVYTPEVGTYHRISISASAGSLRAAMPPFSITVLPKGSPSGSPGSVPPVPPASGPAISGTPTTSVVSGFAYIFKPVVTDPSGAKLTFSIRQSPSWAIFNTATGQLSGTPGSAAVGTTANIVISVSDGKLSASLAPFSITVTAAATGSGPKISGTPSTAATVGAAYSFQPAATDASGAKLTFGIQNRPAWASFNSATGLLTGTPTAAAVGKTGNIVISVSDGQSSVALPSFSITVGQTGTVRTATISWTPPTQNQDGSALTNLAGYIISWGTSASSLTNATTLANAAATSYTVGNLVPGTWYFDVRAYNNLGTNSPQSTIVSATLP
ncbi:MAG: putative Ig domain-containing protein [Sinobacteraceae bacterium]|nr:putative Ig domain-containing protein [Nevskiaceae bacterium]